MAQVDDGCLGQDTLTPCPDCPSDDSELSMGAETFARGCDCVSISSFPGERQVQEDTASLVSTATLVPECIYIPPSGFQLLSDQELAQHKVALQSTSERLDKVTREREALQEALRCSTEDCANQVNVLLDQIKSSEKLLDGLQSNMSDTQQKTARQMAALTASFNRLCQEVNILSEENEKLRAIGGATSPEEQTPAVQTSSVQRAAQYRQERLCIEIVSLQEELKSEQAAKQGLEEQFQREKETHTEEKGRSWKVKYCDCDLKLRLHNVCPNRVLHVGIRKITLKNVIPLQAPYCMFNGTGNTGGGRLGHQYICLSLIFNLLVATLSSLRTEMDRIQQERKQTDLQLQESESQVQKLWDSLGEQEKILQEEREEKASLHETLLEERNKIFRLQTDLATSEEVQRDFVRLSQSLQVSLEKIRQAKSLKEVQDILEGTRLTDVNQLRDT
ncbi:rab GTPase-binding effector protein 2 [Pelobates fuscus]|uniref:rab GTPase-binding effector protein 2 n=1 Tax=Pelobates fuscus TaxID=191477 RepID=UPI002FE4D15E